MINSPSPSSPPQPSAPLNGSALPPQPPATGDKKRVLLVVFILLFIAAIGGGLIAYQNLNKSGSEELTEVQPTLAWRPTVTGTCAGGTIVRDSESVPFLINLDLKLNGTDVAPTQVFISQAPDNSIDKTFNWNFSTAVKKDDKITWNATVKYTQNGNLHEEKYSGTIDIRDNCTTASPSPSPTTTPTGSPSATPSRSPSATPTRSPSPTPTGTPPVGGPSNTPTPTPTETPTPVASSTSTPTVAQTTSTPQPDNRAVADATETLPTVGTNNGVMFAIIGGASLLVSGVFAMLKRKYY
ncbi:MAG: LPXTG cell wall anchor domain-containing protein [bacterium]|nr:LPXTG cell wall anchor domain-containing protein [bacterium]